MKTKHLIWSLFFIGLSALIISLFIRKYWYVSIISYICSAFLFYRVYRLIGCKTNLIAFFWSIFRSISWIFELFYSDIGKLGRNLLSLGNTIFIALFTFFIYKEKELLISKFKGLGAQWKKE